MPTIQSAIQWVLNKQQLFFIMTITVAALEFFSRWGWLGEELGRLCWHTRPWILCPFYVFIFGETSQGMTDIVG